MNKLKELRQELGWTQEQLTEKLNVKKSAISKYENERVPLIDETILKLCNIFDVSADYFLGNTDNFFKLFNNFICSLVYNNFSLYPLRLG